MPDSETLRRLVVECLERLEQDGPAVVDELCARHPDEATALRRRLSILGGAGLLRSRASDELPERLGEYRLLARLGGGAMGVVYEAEQAGLGRTVALKLVRPEHLFFPGARERFRREVEVVARLAHPGVVPIHAVGEEQGIPYFAMEHVRGLTLAEVLEGLDGVGAQPGRAPTGDALGALLAARLGGEVARFPQSWERSVLELIRQAAEALEHCHRRGVLHRDVKPSNLMLRADGRVQLLDFGIAATEDAVRLTHSGAQLGSPAYMSPEQLRGEHAVLDARTDVYSLGVTLYELLTRRLPYPGATTEESRRLALQGTPPRPRALNPALSRDAEAVCLKAMDLERARRYASAGDLARELSAVLEGRPVGARPPGPLRRGARWARRHPAAVVTLAAAIVLPAALAWQQRQARLRVDAERSIAQTNLQAALEAVDTLLLRVGDAALADVPQMEPLRAALFEDALGLLERLRSLETGDPALARLTARARHRAGSLAGLLGRSDEAEAAFVRAEELFAALPGAGFELADARVACAELLLADAPRREDALAALAAAREALAPLPETQATRLLSARIDTAEGFAADSVGRSADAVAAYERACTAARAAVAAEPGSPDARLGLATALGQLAKPRRDRRPDLERLRESAALFEALVAERPESADLRLRLATARNTLGYVLHHSGESEAALAAVLAARDDYARLAQDFPRVPRYRLELASALSALGVLSQDDAARSEAFQRESLALVEQVYAESPAQIDLAMNLTSGHANLAPNLAQQGRAADALAELERSDAARQQLLAGNPEHPMAKPMLEHQLHTLELLLPGDRSPALDALARRLADEALAAGLRDAAALSSPPWVETVAP